MTPGAALAVFILNDAARYALRAGLGPPRILEAGASLELLEPLEMREGVHSESVLGGR